MKLKPLCLLVHKATGSNADIMNLLNLLKHPVLRRENHLHSLICKAKKDGMIHPSALGSCPGVSVAEAFLKILF